MQNNGLPSNNLDLDILARSLSWMSNPQKILFGVVLYNYQIYVI